MGGGGGGGSTKNGVHNLKNLKAAKNRNNLSSSLAAATAAAHNKNLTISQQIALVHHVSLAFLLPFLLTPNFPGNFPRLPAFLFFSCELTYELFCSYSSLGRFIAFYRELGVLLSMLVERPRFVNLVPDGVKGIDKWT